MAKIKIVVRVGVTEVLFVGELLFTGLKSLELLSKNKKVRCYMSVPCFVVEIILHFSSSWPQCNQRRGGWILDTVPCGALPRLFLTDSITINFVCFIDVNDRWDPIGSKQRRTAPLAVPISECEDMVRVGTTVVLSVAEVFFTALKALALLSKAKRVRWFVAVPLFRADERNKRRNEYLAEVERSCQGIE